MNKKISPLLAEKFPGHFFKISIDFWNLVWYNKGTKRRGNNK